MTKYCGYEIGKDITEEQVGRLFELMHKKFKPSFFLELDDFHLHLLAEEYKEEWY